jgi:hypothetical protein
MVLPRILGFIHTIESRSVTPRNVQIARMIRSDPPTLIQINVRNWTGSEKVISSHLSKPELKN